MTKTNTNPNPERQAMIEALKEMPIIQAACRKAGISRATYYRWRSENPDFAQLCDTAWREGIELVNDMSESQVIQLIKEKKLPAIALWLKHNSPHYGAKATPRTSSAVANLTPAEEKIFRSALALSAGSTATNQHDKKDQQKKATNHTG